MTWWQGAALGIVLGALWVAAEVVYVHWRMRSEGHRHDWMLYELEPPCYVCRWCDEMYCEGPES